VVVSFRPSSKFRWIVSFSTREVALVMTRLRGLAGNGDSVPETNVLAVLQRENEFDQTKIII